MFHYDRQTVTVCVSSSPYLLHNNDTDAVPFRHQPFFSIVISAYLFPRLAILRRASTTSAFHSASLLQLPSSSSTTVLFVHNSPSCPFIPPLLVTSSVRPHLLPTCTFNTTFLYRFLHCLSFKTLALLFPHLPQQFYCRNLQHFPATRPISSYPSSVSSLQLALLTTSNPFKTPLHVFACSFRTVSTHLLSVIAAGGHRRAPYTYRTKSTILYDIGPVIRGTVSNDAWDNIQLWSELRRLTNATPLPNSASKTDERGQDFRKWLEKKR